jgi:hypothetical protein
VGHYNGHFREFELQLRKILRKKYGEAILRDLHCG